MKVTNDGVEIHVDDRGGNGQPLVLIMGIGAQLVLWPQGFRDALTARGYRVICIDNRDVGESSHLSHLPMPDPRVTLARAALGLRINAPYTLTHMADDVRAVLDHLNIDKAHIVGMSMGGMIAQTFCLDHQSRALSLTSISSTTSDRRYVLLAKFAAIQMLLGPPPRTREESAERVFSTFRAIGSKTHPAEEALLREMGATSFDRGANPEGFARHLAAICASGSRRSRLPSLRVPTLVVHGTQDPLIPIEAGHATARLIPGARLLELTDMGHDLPRPLWTVIADAIASIASAPQPPRDTDRYATH